MLPLSTDPRHKSGFLMFGAQGICFDVPTQAGYDYGMNVEKRRSVCYNEEK